MVAEGRCMSVWHSLGLVWLITALVMTGGWAWQRLHQNIGIVDVLWAGSLGVSAVLLAVVGAGGRVPRALLALLGFAWGLRLALHLWLRVRSEAEDGRYLQLRQHWGGHQGKILLFFQFQALLVVMFALPFLAVAANPQPLHIYWSSVGVLVWLLCVAGEAIADRQLAVFRASPANRGRTCRAGFWRYSRHPNYFFEWLHWFAYVALAAGSPYFWLACLGPVVMYLFLRYISGIPFTEAQALRTRGDDYRDYQATTPLLFPWFPKSRKVQ
jgi:steroid 5-alpha reductase family enzyme